MGATKGLAGVSWAAPGFSHVQSKMRPLTVLQGRRAEFGEKNELHFLRQKEHCIVF